MQRIVGLRCPTCGTLVDVATAHPWRCPAAGGDRHHVLRIVRAPGPLAVDADPHPFVATDGELAWAAFADAHGMRRPARDALVRELDAAVAGVAGVGFTVTPLARSASLSDALGFSPSGGVWVKDETGSVAGSHKARHLFGILLHLRAAELLGFADPGDRPPFAIASCGNAALAAATLAAAVGWPLAVYVPPWADPVVVGHLERLGATVVTCPRRTDDPPGDPCVHRFREAVAAGAVPFSVQGPENALCLDGGRTLGIELAVGAPAGGFDRAVVQVGGGALATCVADGLAAAGASVRLHAVQTEACAPLARAWARAVDAGDAQTEDRAAAGWPSRMWPWESVGTSAATGILDDETYDWVGIVEAMARTGGGPVVVPEPLVTEAQALAAATGIDADATGTAGLAGLLALVRAPGGVGPDERVVVVFSGTRRR